MSEEEQVGVDGEEPGHLVESVANIVVQGELGVCSLMVLLELLVQHAEELADVEVVEDLPRDEPH